MTVSIRLRATNEAAVVRLVGAIQLEENDAHRSSARAT